MRPLLAILFPPGYFFIAGKPIAGIIHLIVWCISIPLFFLGIGIFMYVVQVIMAMWDYRHYMIHQHAELLAEKMAERVAITGRTE